MVQPTFTEDIQSKKIVKFQSTTFHYDTWEWFILCFIRICADFQQNEGPLKGNKHLLKAKMIEVVNGED